MSLVDPGSAEGSPGTSGHIPVVGGQPSPLAHNSPSQIGFAFFVMDRGDWPSEGEHGEDFDTQLESMVYFWPQSITRDKQLFLAGSLSALLEFAEAFSPDERVSLLTLQHSKLAVKHIGDYTLTLCGTSLEGDSVLTRMLDTLVECLCFQHGALENFMAPPTGAIPRAVVYKGLVGAMNSIVPLLVRFARNPLRCFDPIPHTVLPVNGDRCFIFAAQLVSTIQKMEGNFGCAVFFRSSVLSTGIDPGITSFIMCHIEYLETEPGVASIVSLNDTVLDSTLTPPSTPKNDGRRDSGAQDDTDTPPPHMKNTTQSIMSRRPSSSSNSTKESSTPNLRVSIDTHPSTPIISREAPSPASHRGGASTPQRKKHQPHGRHRPTLSTVYLSKEMLLRMRPQRVCSFDGELDPELNPQDVDDDDDRQNSVMVQVGLYIYTINGLTVAVLVDKEKAKDTFHMEALDDLTRARLGRIEYQIFHAIQPITIPSDPLDSPALPSTSAPGTPTPNGSLLSTLPPTSHLTGIQPGLALSPSLKAAPSDIQVPSHRYLVFDSFTHTVEGNVRVAESDRRFLEHACQVHDINTRDPSISQVILRDHSGYLFCRRVFATEVFHFTPLRAQSAQRTDDFLLSCDTSVRQSLSKDHNYQLL